MSSAGRTPPSGGTRSPSSRTSPPTGDPWSGGRTASRPRRHVLVASRCTPVVLRTCPTRNRPNIAIRTSDAGVLQFGPQREGKRIHERFRGVVHGLICAGHEAGNGAREQDPTLAAAAHGAPHELRQINRASDV